MREMYQKCRSVIAYLGGLDEPSHFELALDVWEEYFIAMKMLRP
jgi:hypothetical protein